MVYKSVYNSDCTHAWNWFFSLWHTIYDSFLLQLHPQFHSGCLCHRSSHTVPKRHTSLCLHWRKAFLRDTVDSSLQHQTHLLLLCCWITKYTVHASTAKTESASRLLFLVISVIFLFLALVNKHLSQKLIKYFIYFLFFWFRLWFSYLQWNPMWTTCQVSRIQKISEHYSTHKGTLLSNMPTKKFVAKNIEQYTTEIFCCASQHWVKVH